jgi:hypothetical protein
MNTQPAAGRSALPVLLVSFFALVASATATAQTAAASLRGKAPPNSTVVAQNLATGLTRRTMASDDGSYSLVGLPPGTYRVDAGPVPKRPPHCPSPRPSRWIYNQPRAPSPP